MKLHDEDAQRALAALSRPLKAHELADAALPDRADRPLTARKHSGHAIGRDLVERGWAVKNADGTYIAASLAEPMPQEPETAEETPLEYEDGYAVRVRREYLGPIAVPPPQRQPPQQPVPQPQEPQQLAPQALQLLERFKEWWSQQQTPPQPMPQAPTPQAPAPQQPDPWAQMAAWLHRAHRPEIERKRALQAELARASRRPRRDRKSAADYLLKNLELLDVEMLLILAHHDWANENAPDIVPELDRTTLEFMQEFRALEQELQAMWRKVKARTSSPWSAPPSSYVPSW